MTSRTQVTSVVASACTIPTELPEADGTAAWESTGVTLVEVSAQDERGGGYTEWLRAAAVAAAHGLEVSAHCAPNLHAPVAAATPNLRHIEWFHDHVRIEEMLFEGALDPAGGTICPGQATVGHGLRLKPEAVARYRTSMRLHA